MKGAEYILLFEKTDISISFNYDLNGLLVAFKIDGILTETQHAYVMGRIPMLERQIERFTSSFKNATITIKPGDLSFERFWQDYSNKKGKLKMAKNLWAKLAEADKVKVLLHIPKYRIQCAKDKVDMAYPSTYINQEYYNNPV